MTDFTTLESLYARGVLDINGKDYINGTNTDISVNSQRDTFLPDSRFTPVDARYIRDRVDRDTFMSSNSTDLRYNPQQIEQENDGKLSFKDNVKKMAGSKLVACIIGSLALFVSGRYILKKLHILK